MHLMYCDESNLQKRAGDFFVYSGLVVDGAAALALSTDIESIRKHYGVPTDFLLKFNPGPPNLSHQQFVELKKAVIEVAVKANCLLLTSLLLHDIATSSDDARRNEINRICYHFDCWLARPKSHGLVLIDRFEDRQIDGHLRDKFSTGITGLPYTAHYRLDRIVGFHYSAIGQSHFASVIDILLGSLRFAVNAHSRNEQGNLSTGAILLKQLKPLFFSEGEDGSVSEIGLFFSPKIIRSDRYRAAYTSLKEYFAASGIILQQTVTNTRTY